MNAQVADSEKEKESVLFLFFHSLRPCISLGGVELAVALAKYTISNGTIITLIVEIRERE